MPENAASNPELAECSNERDSAYETLNKDQAEYDKQLLALSAAFLGVALARPGAWPIRARMGLCP